MRCRSWARISPETGTRLILLGTAGGPRPNPYRSAPAQVLVIDGRAHVVDCGSGVARQLVLAGLPLHTLTGVYLTHHHSDHNADYGNLLLLAWAAGLRAPVDTYGPPPLCAMRDLFLRLNDTDIRTRIGDEGRVPFAPLFRATEVDQPGLVFRGKHVRVTAAVVDHPQIELALAYRFDAQDVSIVISGDTAVCPALVELARGADVLVHEAMYLPALEAMARRLPHARRLLDHLRVSHTSAEDAGRVAAAAGVSTLVLSHLIPADDPEVTDDLWRAAAGAHFRGEVIVGRDLLEVPVGG